MPEPGHQITVTLTMDQYWHEKLEERFAEAQQEYPRLRMEQFIAWSVRYYLQHAYNEEEEESECECGTTIRWLTSFFGEDYLKSHISNCSNCGQHTLHISDESARCVYPGCGYSSG